MISSRSAYAEQSFSQEALDGKEIHDSEFQHCRFEACSLVETTFRNSRFAECRFLDCDLSLIQVPDSIFATTTFDQSKVIGVDWTRADWLASRLEMPIGFMGCSINHSTFIGLRLPGITIRDCMAVDVDFREAKLSGADFTSTVLTGSLFLGTDLTEADFRGAREYSIDLTQNVTSRAKFSLPEAISLLFNLDIDLEGSP